MKYLALLFAMVTTLGLASEQPNKKRRIQCSSPGKPRELKSGATDRKLQKQCWDRLQRVNYKIHGEEANEQAQDEGTDMQVMDPLRTKLEYYARKGGDKENEPKGHSQLSGMEKKWDALDIGNECFELPESYELFIHQYEQRADDEEKKREKREWMSPLDWQIWHDAFTEYERLFESDGSLK